MSAPGIPDLRTLLRSNRPSRRGGRIQGRGNRGSVAAANDDPSGLSSSRDINNNLDNTLQSQNGNTKDHIVQQTDRDATFSRVSAVESGYLEDPFAKCFLEAGETVERRFPIINRGTFVRTYAIDLLVDIFLSSPSGQQGHHPKKQIISLGAGSDTRWFRLVSRRSSSPSPSPSSSTLVPASPEIVYHELDFPTNTSRKIKSIQQSPLLLSTLQQSSSSSSSSSPIQISEDGTQLLSQRYNIHPVDLRTLHPPSSSSSSPSPSSPSPSSSTSHPPPLPNIDPSIPTLLISECCLIYLPPSSADAILQYFTSHLFPSSTPLRIILYEPIRPFDPFGEVMQANLARRGIVLQTLHRYSSLRKQKERLMRLGFEGGQGAVDVDFVWERWVQEEEKERVGRLEMLDEVEEWRLLGRHYCVGWGWRENRIDREGENGKGGEESGVRDEGGDGRASARKDVFADWEDLLHPSSSSDIDDDE